MQHTISIIIPILNEAETIENLLNYLIENSATKNITEIIVVDGGSTDKSQCIVTNFFASSDSEQRETNQKSLDTPHFKRDTRPDVFLIHSEKGRAKQMNLGAQKAKGNILYFLHADSFPPQHFDSFIINEVINGKQAGCFRMQFNSNHWWLKLAGWFTKFNWKICRGGDQSLFITKDLFDYLGGYDESYVICEDSVIVKKLYAKKHFTVINKKLTTSARRYEKNGIWKLQYHFFRIHFMKYFGASAESLLSYYKKHVN